MFYSGLYISPFLRNNCHKVATSQHQNINCLLLLQWNCWMNQIHRREQQCCLSMLKYFLLFIKDGVGTYLVGRPIPALNISLVFKPNCAKFVFHLKRGEQDDD